MRRRIQWWLILSVSLLIGVWAGVIGVQAATSAPQTPSSAPSSILGLNIAGGFTQQPIDTNVVSGQTVNLSANATRSAIETAASLGTVARRYVWWESTDGGKTYSIVQTSGNTTASNVYSFTAPTVSTPTQFKFQVQYRYTGLLFYSDYWSQIATVTVQPQRVAATSLSVTADNQTLNNGETTTVHADIAPSDATDAVTWTSSDPNLATVDAYGNVTATSAASTTDGKAADHGTVTITGTVNGESSAVKLTIGALQDVTVVEGTPATFTLAAIPSAMTVTNWYRVQAGNVTALNTTANSYTIKTPTNADDDNTAYFAKLSYTGNGNTQSVTTNAALLTVKKGGDLTLNSTPNFDFGQTNLAALAQGVTLGTDNQAVTSTNTFDGSNTGQLQVTDQRTVGSNWTIYLTVSPFTLPHQTTSPINDAQLHVMDVAAGVNQTVAATNAAIPLFTSQGFENKSFDLNASQLQLGASPKASDGTYQSTLTWTLSAVPAP